MRQMNLGELCARLQSRVEETEQRRSLPPETVADLHNWGAFGALVPRMYQGQELDLLDFFESVVTIGRVCSSSAWVTSLMAIHSVILAWFPKPAQDAVWKVGPDVPIASSLAPVGVALKRADGIVLEGHWRYATGLDFSPWLLLGARLEDKPLLALVPREQVEPMHDWDALGLAGSGSHSLLAREVQVPWDRVLMMAALESGNCPGRAHHRGRLFHLPWRPLFSYTFVPAAVGVAQAALQDCREAFANRISAYTGQLFRERTHAARVMAEAAVEVEMAELLMREQVQALFRSPDDPEVVARTSFGPAWIVNQCRSAVDRLFRLSGAGALWSGNSLQRRFRDVLAMAQHPGVNLEVAGENYGKWLLNH